MRRATHAGRRAPLEQHPFGEATVTPVGVGHQRALRRHIVLDRGGRRAVRPDPAAGTDRIKTAP